MPTYVEAECPICRCDECEARLGPVLLKACSDSYCYLARLRSGESVQFESAEVHGDWIHLSGISRVTPAPTVAYGGEWSFGRGMDVHLRDIVWCSDGES